ncbi:DMT family transporter [Austwickia chelonae]|uniref:DMT family transporter n=1 Tax=Austwickia chelonae TaxID=100225 RepID=UPI000E24C053|nr:DMT family transporter [Austwickia chelonae]
MRPFRNEPDLVDPTPQVDLSTPVITVLLLSLASAASAACSTVAKHASAQRPTPESRFAQALPPLLATMIASPLWLLGLVFDVGGIILQVLALRYGDISVVQPVLTASLLIALILSRWVSRIRIRKTEIAWGLCLIAGLVIFLASSGSFGSHGGEGIGRTAPGVTLGVISLVGCAFCAEVARRSTGRHRARALAVIVAVLYVAMAGFIKSSSRIFDVEGPLSMLLSWQLWGLVICAATAMICQQVAYSAAPLAQSQPVVAALDPLFAVLLGVVVYGEMLRYGPMDLIAEAIGLSLLLSGVVGISRISADQEDPRPETVTLAPR